MKQMKKRFSATVSDTMRAMIQSGDDTSLDLVTCVINHCDTLNNVSRRLL